MSYEREYGIVHDRTVFNSIPIVEYSPTLVRELEVQIIFFSISSTLPYQNSNFPCCFVKPCLFFSVSEAWKISCLSILCEIFVMPHSFSMYYVRMSWILNVCACMHMDGSVCMYRDAMVYMWRSEASLWVLVLTFYLVWDSSKIICP